MAHYKCIVTGGGGFVGFALCRALLGRGFEVVSIARGDYPNLREIGVTTVRADISKGLKEHYKVLSGADVLFHTASKVDMWGRYRDFYLSNV
ncbi:MAG: NAD-dependent epimerase/dehydratase family protein, partial [Candidatus Dadabacteria bacterium]